MEHNWKSCTSNWGITESCEPIITNFVSSKIWKFTPKVSQSFQNDVNDALGPSGICSAVCWCSLGEDASPVEEPILQPVQKLLPRLLYRSVRQCKTNQGLHDCISSRSLYTKQLSISQETSRYRPLVAHPIYQIWIKQILKVHTQSFSSKAKKKTKFPIRCTGLSRTFWHMHSYNKNTKGNQHGNDASCLLLIYPTTMVSRRGWRWGWLSRGWLCQCKSIFACSFAASLLSGEGLFQSEYVQLHLWPEYRYQKSEKNESFNKYSANNSVASSLLLMFNEICDCNNNWVTKHQSPYLRLNVVHHLTLSFDQYTQVEENLH